MELRHPRGRRLPERGETVLSLCLIFLPSTAGDSLRGIQESIDSSNQWGGVLRLEPARCRGRARALRRGLGPACLGPVHGHHVAADADRPALSAAQPAVLALGFSDHIVVTENGQKLFVPANYGFGVYSLANPVPQSS